jgi:hypothetical protein
MTYVITEPYIDVKDRGCVDECPVERTLGFPRSVETSP